MLVPSLRNYAFTKVIDYSSLVDIGTPHAAEYPTEDDNNRYRRSVWSLFDHGGFLYVGGGNAQDGSHGTNIGADNGSTCLVRAINLADDSIVTVPYTGNSSKEIRVFQNIDGDLYVPSIDNKEGADADVFRLEAGNMVTHQMVADRNHCYFLHKSRRNGRWLVATGITVFGQGVFYSAATFEDFPATTPTAVNYDNMRGQVIMEFGENESSRLICLQIVPVYRPGTYHASDPADPTANEGSSGPKAMYEFNFADNTFTPLTNYPFLGLPKDITHTDIANTSITNLAYQGQNAVCVEKVAPLDNDTYIGLIGKSSSYYGRSRFTFPGDFLYNFYETHGSVTMESYGGVYKITLSDTKPFAAANGNTFLNCERMLPITEGRQWDFQIVGSDVYILTETTDLNCHVYKNGRRIITLTNMPTFARSFRIVGNHIYFGLGGEALDSFRKNLQVMPVEIGKVLKAPNILWGVA